MHIRKIQDVQTDLAKKLDELEQQSSKKITSDSYHVGFDKSYISKAGPAEKPSSTKEEVELLNPQANFHQEKGDMIATSNATATGSSLDEGEEEPPAPRASPVAKEFAQIKTCDYRASHEFLLSHPEILQESEMDGLLLKAYSGDPREEHGRCKAVNSACEGGLGAQRGGVAADAVGDGPAGAACCVEGVRAAEDDG